LAFKTSIFRKLLLASLLLIGVSLLSADFFLTRYIGTRELLAAQTETAKVANILAPTLTAPDYKNLQAWAEDADRKSGYRVTVIDSHGVVLADSAHDPKSMENHASRNEVRSALAGTAGGDIRRSATLDVDFYYFAVPVNTASGRIVLRLAVPLDRVNASIGAARLLILRSSALAIAISLPFAYLVARSFTRRARMIQGYATALVKSDYSVVPSIEADDEFGSVARSLRFMAEEFRRMMSLLSQESARRAAIMSSLSEGVLAVDQDLRVTFCNDAFLSIVQARLPLTENASLVHLVRDPALRDLLVRVIATGRPERERITLLGAKGRTFDVQTAPFNEHSKKGAIATLYDISDLERLERVRKDFVANLSHELRTPLAAIRGYTETLLDGGLEDHENNRRFLQIIAAHADRLKDLADDVLTLADLEAERKFPAERVSVLESAVNALRTVEADAQAHHVRAALGQADNVYISGWRFAVERALLNLLQNAIKYNRPGGEVSVNIQCKEDTVRISVCDTGIGIPSAELSRIFERFYRIDGARSRETGGTGLGLSIVKNAAEQMGGFVTVESKLGKGSTFTLIFPAG
jgi:two-component system phosphate regulon sensor histidine kinase PhoR